MLVKVSELKGRALNYACAFILWGSPWCAWEKRKGDYFWEGHHSFPGMWNISTGSGPIGDKEFNPSGNWAHTGILIDEFHLTIRDRRLYAERKFLVSCEYTGDDDDYTVEAQPNRDAKIAICHAVCMTENGNDEIEIPDELMEA